MKYFVFVFLIVATFYSSIIASDEIDRVELDILNFMSSLKSDNAKENVFIDNMYAGLTAYKTLYPNYKIYFTKNRHDVKKCVTYEFFESNNADNPLIKYTITKYKCDKIPEKVSKVQFTNFCLLTRAFH